MRVLGLKEFVGYWDEYVTTMKYLQKGRKVIT
jgi:hypothetical protein